MDMRQFTRLGVVCFAAFSLVSAARADDDRCKDVNGHDVVTSIPAPNDPLGRSLGSSTGDLKAAISAVLTSLTPQPDGSIQATGMDVWVLGPQDILIFNGKPTVTPIPGAPVGTVSVSGTLTVAGGTGKFAGASGITSDEEHGHVGTSNCKNESDHGQENLDGLLIVVAHTLNSLRGTEGQNAFLRLWIGSAQAEERGALKDRI